MKKLFMIFIISFWVSGVIFASGNQATNVMDDGIYNSNTDQSIPKNSYGYRQINPDQLKKMLGNKEFILINVHVPYQGEIPNTDSNIAFNQVNEIKAQYPNTEIPIVLYCRSGSMSQAASRELVKLGYTNILELKGGFNSWKRSGYQLLFKE